MKKFELSYKHIFLIPAMVVCIFLAWILMPMIYNPMRRPAPMLRNHILRHTPIGMCIEEVIEVIGNNERWGTPSVNRRAGFRHPRHNVPGWPTCSMTGAAIIGDKSIHIRTGEPLAWRLPERGLHILWGFDEAGKLIEVYVRASYK